MKYFNNFNFFVGQYYFFDWIEIMPSKEKMKKIEESDEIGQYSLIF